MSQSEKKLAIEQAADTSQGFFSPSSEYYEALFKETPALMAIAGFDGYFKELNQAWETVLGHTVETLLEKPYIQWVHPDDVEAMLSTAQKLKESSESAFHFQNRYLCHDGSWRYLSWFSKPDRQGQLIFATAFDVTDMKESENRIQRREQLLREIGNMANVGGWELDLEQMQLFWTDEMYTIHELENKETQDIHSNTGFYAPEARPVIESAVNAGIRYGRPWDVELPLITAKGNRIWVHSLGKAEQLNGKSVRLFGAFQNITDRRNLEQSLRKSISALRDLHQVTSAQEIGLDEKIQRILKLGVEVFELPVGIVSNINNDTYLVEYVECVDKKLDHCKFKVGQAYKLKQTYCNHTLKNQGVIAFHNVSQSEISKYSCYQQFKLESYIGTPLLVQGNTYGTLVFCGPTQHALFTYRELELIKLFAQWIANELSQHLSNKALEIAKDEAERANKTKSAFLANMSHELRTPLNSIIGFTHRIIKRGQNSLNERDLDALQTVEKNGRYLLGLINDILDISRIESGKMELEKKSVSLSSLLKEVEMQMKGAAEKKQLVFTIHYSPNDCTIYADPTKLLQILLNLASNAVKYTDIGHVDIFYRTAMSHEQREQVEIIVKDTGLGINKDDQNRLFHKFERFHERSVGAIHGTGLGLALVWEFTKMHGGHISVESDEGIGSCFTVVLPRVMLDSVDDQ